MGTIPQLTPARLAADRESVCVLDVREPDEVAGGHIAGSINIPLGQLSARTRDLDRPTPIVTVCRSGRRSQIAAETLAAAGFTVANLAGGMTAWIAGRHPVVTR